MSLLEHVHHTDTAARAEVPVTDQELHTRSMTVRLPGVMEFNKLKE